MSPQTALQSQPLRLEFDKPPTKCCLHGLGRLNQVGGGCGLLKCYNRHLLQPRRSNLSTSLGLAGVISLAERIATRKPTNCFFAIKLILPRVCLQSKAGQVGGWTCTLGTLWRAVFEKGHLLPNMWEVILSTMGASDHEQSRCKSMHHMSIKAHSLEQNLSRDQSLACKDSSSSQALLKTRETSNRKQSASKPMTFAGGFGHDP